MKKFKLLLCLSMMLLITTKFVYANEIEQIGVEKINQEYGVNFTDALGEERINNKETLTIDLGDGNTATLTPVSGREGRLNTTKSIFLTNRLWHEFEYDTPVWVTDLRVVNKSSNPGSIDVKVVTSYFDNNTHIYWDLPVGYQVTFSLRVPSYYTVWVSANAIEGNYSIQATDW